MKKVLLPLFIVLFQTLVFGQTKVYENEGVDSDTESAYIYNFLTELNKHPESKGLIIIYLGSSLDRLGNVLAFKQGVESYIDYYSSRDKVSVSIVEGKNPFFKEMWSIPKEAKSPEVKPISLNFDSLITKYFYAFDCLDCDPAVPGLSFSTDPDLEYYAKILKENKNFQGVIEIYVGNYTGSTAKRMLKEALKYAGDYRRALTSDYGTHNKRITIRIKKSLKENLPTTANLYIVPRKQN